MCTSVVFLSSANRYKFLFKYTCAVWSHHDIVMTRKVVLHYLQFVRKIHQSLIDSIDNGPAKGTFDIFIIHKLLNNKLSCRWFRTSWHPYDITLIFNNLQFQINKWLINQEQTKKLCLINAYIKIKYKHLIKTINNKANLRILIAATGLVILLKLNSNRWFFTRVTLKFDGWPRKIIRHVFYTTSSFNLCVSFQIH